MSVREAGRRSGRGGPGRELRARWSTASAAAGWRYPSDWGVPEVDAVCASVVLRADVRAALAGLGRARARAGAGLDETLGDLAALHAVLDSADGLVSAAPAATPAELLHVVAVAWADAALGVLRDGGGAEPLTGLATAAYLRTRLGEIYRRGAREGRCPADRYVLLVVTLDLAGVAGWSRPAALALVADVLREVFDGGESLAVLGPSVLVVLAERDAGLARRAARARRAVADRLCLDPHLRHSGVPQVRIERLPAGEAAARLLVDGVARA